MRTTCSTWLVVATLAGLTAAPAPAAEQAANIILRSIQIADGVPAVVIIDADGPLPLATSDLIENPSRIYLDLAGVTPKTARTIAAPPGSVVSRVRVALHSTGPNVTRVVLDLTRHENYRIDVNQRQAGRIRILVGPETGPVRPVPAGAAPSVSPTPPRPANPTAAPAPVPAAATGPVVAPGPVVLPAPAAPAPRSPKADDDKPALDTARRLVTSSEMAARSAIPPKEAERYRQQLFVTLGRMEARRSLVAQIKADQNVDMEALKLSSQEFHDLRRSLETVKPSAALSSAHELLIASCAFGAIAASLRMEATLDNSVEIRRNASSAAAGYLMLFDRACADLGCAQSPR